MKTFLSNAFAKVRLPTTQEFHLYDVGVVRTTPAVPIDPAGQGPLTATHQSRDCDSRIKKLATTPLIHALGRTIHTYTEVVQAA